MVGLIFPHHSAHQFQQIKLYNMVFYSEAIYIS